ncbi:PAS domain S-box protein [Salinisphaera sp. T31B1]|uniref:PAS domain S-box protein n=1 Tax=Salinisphaera sp. T31B1 TaxID=727963 RepID=UPI0033403089
MIDNNSINSERVPSELRALNINYAVAVFDRSGQLIRANNRYLKLFGTTLEHALGSDESASYAIQADRNAQARWAALRAGQICDQTALRVVAGGSQAWIRTSYTPILAEGELVEVVVIFEDVTEAQLRLADDRGQVRAINVSQAVAHFGCDGTIVEVNERFCAAVGYMREELVGRHHRMLVAADEARSAAYRAFWSELASGHHQTGEFRRIRKDGSDAWLQASYNPVFDPAGRVIKIVKYATDVTSEKLRQAEYQWQVAAIHKSNAVVVFDMHGTVLDANEAFLEAMGYSADQVIGEHHRIFVEPAYAHSIEYAQFWRNLELGRHHAGQYQRVASNGDTVWLQASYNPIFDMAGRPVKVIKYATIVTDEKLLQADHQGQIAAIHKAQCVVSFDVEGTILDANDNFLRLMGYRYRDVRGRHHRMFVEDRDAESDAYKTFWRQLAAGRHKVAEFKRLGNEGREVWLQASYNPIFDMNGKVFKVVKYATDITREKIQQADYKSQIDAINKSQGVVELGLDGTILDVNSNFLETFGYRLSELKGKHHSILVMPGVADSDEYVRLWQTLRTGTFHTGLYRRVGKQGTEIWLQASYNPVLDLNGKPYKVIKFATDVSANVAMAQAYDEAARMAQHDATTALPNRLKLASYMTSALPHPSARLAVFYIDLDGFKPVNDTFGHDVGDRVLGEVADRLRHCLRDDQIAARVGGDEFVVAAPALDDDEIETMCRRILETVAMPVRHAEGELGVTASIGVAISPQDGTSPDELLKNADLALYRSKNDGRATYSYFTEEMNARVVDYRALTQDMRRGLRNDEFILEYQPRFDTRERQIRSVEALIRWAHPEKGVIPPADFIALAERNGLIIPIGEWVLYTACDTIAQRSDTLGVSVNISPIQFRDDSLVETVGLALERSGLSPERLELEITEGVLIDHAEHARSVLERLKTLGVRLAIDDFGTGYSSLSYLRSFPFDVIKIDRRFIRDLDTDDGNRAIVRAILSLGQALDLTVTAEGVETNEQLAMLTYDECSEVQGFLLARPMAIDDLQRLIRNVPAIVERGEEKTVFCEDRVQVKRNVLPLNSRAR